VWHDDHLTTNCRPAVGMPVRAPPAVWHDDTW
jgi:hypothetical protein